MDLRKAPQSTRVTDKTNPRNPDILRWLSHQPTSKSRLEPFEQELMTEGRFSPEDLYLARTMYYPRNAIIRKDYDQELQKDDFLINFLKAQRNMPDTFRTEEENYRQRFRQANRKKR